MTASINWITTPDAPATGFSIRWFRPLDELQSLVGSAWRPLPTRDAHHGSAMLFVTTGTESTLSGHFTGAFQFGVGIVLVEPAKPLPDGVTGQAFAAVNAFYCPAGTRLHTAAKTAGFDVVDADMTLDVQALTARFSLKTATGTVSAQATVPPETVDFASHSTLTGVDATRFVGLGGAESATRQNTTDVTVETTGATWLDHIRAPYPPDAAALDTHFVWNFAFNTLAWGDEDQAT